MAEETIYNQCPSWALSVGYLGVVSAAILSNWGSAVSFVRSYSLDSIFVIWAGIYFDTLVFVGAIEAY